MGNRRATAQDVIDFTPWITQEGITIPMQENDVILDTITNVGDFITYNDNTTWADAGTGHANDYFTIWIHNDLHEVISAIFFGGGGSTPFPNSSTKTVYVRPLNGQVKFVRNLSEPTNKVMEFEDIDNIVIDGELNSYPGLRDGWGSFRSGTFGFWLTDPTLETSTRILSVVGGSLENVTIRGVESQYGFSGFRVARTNENQVINSLTIERVFRHHAVQGEGFYIGQTAEDPANPVFNSVYLRDFIVAMCATEGFQIQNMASGAGSGYIKNFVNFCPDLDWKDAFQANQDTATQLHFQQGGIEVKNFIVDGGGSYSIHVFSSDLTARGINPTGIATITNGVLSDIRQFPIRLHGSLDDGPKVSFRNIDILPPNDTYNEIGGSIVDFVVDSASDTGNDKYFINVKKPSAKGSLLNPSGSFTNTFTISNSNDDTIPAPEYINSGFGSVPCEKIDIWALTDSRNAGAQRQYNEGDFCIHIVTEVESPPVSPEYRYYRANSTHGATSGNEPGQDSTWTLVTWDANGVGSWEDNWNSGLTQYDLPPLDLRLVVNSYHSKLGRGLSCNPQRTDRTQYKWYWKQSAGGAERQIPGAYNYKLDISDYNYLTSGRYIDGGVIRKTDSKQGIEQRNGFTQIT